VFRSFLDGTSHAIGMTGLANAAGFSVDVRGMHFPAFDVRELPNVRHLPTTEFSNVPRCGIEIAATLIISVRVTIRSCPACS